MNVSLPSGLPPAPMGSLTPGLEGAPRSACHPGRMKSVIPSPKDGPDSGKEGSPSKP